MPAFSVVRREFVMLSKLLTEWAPRPGFQSWNRATSSTVIMKTVFMCTAACVLSFTRRSRFTLGFLPCLGTPSGSHLK